MADHLSEQRPSDDVQIWTEAGSGHWFGTAGTGCASLPLRSSIMNSPGGFD